MKFVGAIVVLLVLGFGAYEGYTYVKEKPPPWLIKLVTKTKEPPPLPPGDTAPLTVPEGFTATIFARDVKGVRVMIRDAKGTMLVSETLDGTEGKVVALPDRDNDNRADRTVTVIAGLNQPHGLYMRCAGADSSTCTLYVAETGALKTYAYSPETMTAAYEKTIAEFPTGNGHYTRTILPSLDGKTLYISIGSSCNVCDETDSTRATVQELDLATNVMTTYATGLRNTVFMAFDPLTNQLWGTDNGRDMLGDDTPPDDINIIQRGKNYGWPICYGNNIHDTDFDTKQYVRDPCVDATPPHIALQAHSAALGIAFIRGSAWPAEMQNDVLVAFHGSWNRSVATGYKVVRYNLDQNRNAVGAPADFVTGFLPEGGDPNEAIGRPVGILAEDDAIYISDDRAGAVYRIAPTQ
jgi:glucose/arabinose dehydrogenase